MITLFYIIQVERIRKISDDVFPGSIRSFDLEYAKSNIYSTPASQKRLEMGDILVRIHIPDRR